MLTNYRVIEDINKAIEAGLSLEIAREMHRLSPSLHGQFIKLLADNISSGDMFQNLQLDGAMAKLFIFATQKVNARHGIKDSLGALLAENFKNYLKENRPKYYDLLKNDSDEKIGIIISEMLRTEEF